MILGAGARPRPCLELLDSVIGAAAAEGGPLDLEYAEA
jgi:hypothetical protein